MSLDPTLQRAIQHHQAGRLADAEPLYRQVLAQNPNHPTALHLLGVIAGQVGRFDIAESLIRQAIAIHPREPFYYLNLGKFLLEAGRPEAAADALRGALHLNRDLPDAHSSLGAALRGMGQIDASLACHAEARRLNPASPEILLNSGNALHSAGRIDEAIATYHEALRLAPESVSVLNNLGATLKLQGRPAEALPILRRAIELQPTLAEAHDNLGTALHALGQYADAIVAFHRALELNPRFPEAFNNLGVTLNDIGDHEAALAAYRQALALRPKFPDALNNLGNVSLIRGNIDAAVDAFQQTLALRPNSVDALNNLGNALKDRADLAGARGAFRRALELDPAAADAHSNLLFTMHFDPAVTARDILGEARRWNAQHAAPLAARIRPHANDPSPPSPDRPLRIAIISPDLREHCLSFFNVPLFTHLDRTHIHLTVYSDVRAPDAITARLQSYTGAWRNILGKSDDEVAALIRADRIDVLIDITMHMAHNRLRVLAQKPAPVQASWLAYPGTTGVSTVDYRISDPYLDPPDADLSVYAEKTLRLPDTFWCYDPLTFHPVNDLPALRQGHITFGSLNNFCKVNDGVIDLWAQVMNAVPGSRLLLLCPEGRHRQPLLRRFGDHGISADRIELLARHSRENYLRLYHRIDLGLDTFPYNGHTTSLDALWMGVPVITKVGDTVAGRAGFCQSMNLGLPDWASHTPAAFVETATSLAGDLSRLAHIRQNLRSRIEASPLMDGPRFARHFAAACRWMWDQWRAGDSR